MDTGSVILYSSMSLAGAAGTFVATTPAPAEACYPEFSMQSCAYCWSGSYACSYCQNYGGSCSGEDHCGAPLAYCGNTSGGTSGSGGY
jgi:hypothetical protein